MRIQPLLGELHGLEASLAAAYREASERHAAEHDVHHELQSFAEQCDGHAARLDGDGGHRDVALSGDLLADLRALFVLAEEVSITWVMAGQAAQALRDDTLLATVRECHVETELQVKWLTTRIKTAAPQALVVG